MTFNYAIAKYFNGCLLFKGYKCKISNVISLLNPNFRSTQHKIICLKEMTKYPSKMSHYFSFMNERMRHKNNN
ncbi:hypothetical protein BpHYR1_005876 [Brachionus plicatilis]|uniref:Uncharacterized protein n=1 Tax=Brachionus plicatilis TaxID=10195 RepID=A0A3M7T9Z3_BRAPC|nr:hypothetical protein BpHYR1_005876 [Brachionus plicatilis]